MMATRRVSARLSGGSAEHLSPPTTPTLSKLPSVSKRKTLHNPDEPLPVPDDFQHPPKRTKKQNTKTKASARATGKGGLIIDKFMDPVVTPAASSSQAGPSSSIAPSQPPRRPPPLPAPAFKPPPDKRSKPGPSKSSSSSDPKGKSKLSKEILTIDEREQDKMVAREIKDLRQQQSSPHSKSSGPSSLSFASSPAVEPSSSSRGRDGTSKVLGQNNRIKDLNVPVPIHDTPRIEKNREMRNASERRRSGSSGRGRRASGSIGKTGGITLPHSNVPSKELYKHVASDLPEPQRARQLLVCTASRSQTLPDQSSSSTKPLPTLSPSASALLKTTQDELIRMMAEGNIDTNVWSKSNGKGKEKVQPKKEHPINIKNRERLQAMRAEVDLVKAEDAAWSQVIQSYNERQARVTAGLAAQSSTAPKSPSEWMSNLDDQWKDAARIAQAEIDGLDGGRIEESLRDMLLSVEENIDDLHSTMHAISDFAERADGRISTFFSNIAKTLDHRTPVAAPTSLTTLLSSIPATATNSSAPFNPPNDTIEALRALTRVAPLPGTSRSGAAVRAAQEARTERKVTAVPPTPSRTPRKSVKR